MAEDAPPGGGDMSGGQDQDQSETASLPISMMGQRPLKEGDMIQVRVISVDQQGGVVNVALADSGPPKKPGSDGMAEELDKPPQEEAE